MSGFNDFLSQFSFELVEETHREIEKTRSQVASKAKRQAIRCVNRLIALEPIEDRYQIWELIEDEDNWWDDWAAAFSRAVEKMRNL